jgi:hypothetical protein
MPASTISDATLSCGNVFSGTISARVNEEIDAASVRLERR